MKSAPGLRGLYPRPERRGFTQLLVTDLAPVKLMPISSDNSLSVAFGFRRIAASTASFCVVSSTSTDFCHCIRQTQKKCPEEQF